MPIGIHNGHKANSGSFKKGLIPHNKGKGKKYNCVQCGRGCTRYKTMCSICYRNNQKLNKKTREEKLELMRNWHRKVKDEVFEAYGGYICKCCGEY